MASATLTTVEARSSFKRGVLRALAATLLACAAGNIGCNRSKSAAPASSAEVQPKTPDRLAPGELAEGQGDLFGLKLPRGMHLEARFPTSAHASGELSAEKLSNYVRKRVEASHVELAASRTVFPKARIKGGNPERLYRVEIIPSGRKTVLTVELLNPPRPPAVQGLSQAERYERAGLTPDGKMLNPQELE